MSTLITPLNGFPTAYPHASIPERVMLGAGVGGYLIRTG
jgi:hypothetical protein